MPILPKLNSACQKYVIPSRDNRAQFSCLAVSLLGIDAFTTFFAFIAIRNDAAHQWCNDDNRQKYCSDYFLSSHELPPEAIRHGNKVAGASMIAVAPAISLAFFGVYVITLVVYNFIRAKKRHDTQNISSSLINGAQMRTYSQS